MNLRQEKIARLKSTQKGLRARSSSTNVLQVQQKALRNNLLTKVPFSETQHARVLKLQRDQSIKKSILLKRQKEKEDKERILRQIKTKKIKGLFFPKAKRRR